MMENKKIKNLADLQAEKAKIREDYLTRESVLNTKLNYLQNNFGGILLQTLSFRKQNINGQHITSQNTSFTSSIIKAFTGINVNGEKVEVLLSVAKTVLPTIILSLLKGYFKRKFSK